MKFLHTFRLTVYTFKNKNQKVLSSNDFIEGPIDDKIHIGFSVHDSVHASIKVIRQEHRFSQKMYIIANTKSMIVQLYIIKSLKTDIFVVYTL